MAIEGIPHKDSDLPQSNHSTTGGPAMVGQDVILVIDDDTEVLNSVRRLLIREGWVVLTASSPLEGLALYEAHWREIQLVLLDYFMPILRGDKVFERLQRINPHVRVLLTTACDDDVSPKMLQGGLCGFVQKPLSPRALIGGIRKSLNHHGPQCPPPPSRDGSNRSEQLNSHWADRRSRCLSGRRFGT
jgi:DNA-binding NtrC family response regulator